MNVHWVKGQDSWILCGLGQFLGQTHLRILAPRERFPCGTSTTHTEYLKAKTQPGMVSNANKVNTWEAEAGGSRVQGYLQLHSKFKFNLDHPIKGKGGGRETMHPAPPCSGDQLGRGMPIAQRRRNAINMVGVHKLGKLEPRHNKVK